MSSWGGGELKLTQSREILLLLQEKGGTPHHRSAPPTTGALFLQPYSFLVADLR